MASTTDKHQAAPTTNNQSDDHINRRSGKHSGASTASGEHAASGERSASQSRSHSRTPSNNPRSSANGTPNHSRRPSATRPPLSPSNSAVSSREASPIRPALRSLNSSSTSHSVSQSRRNSEEANLFRTSSDTAINSQAPPENALQKRLANVNKPHLPPPDNPPPPPTSDLLPSDTRRPSRSAMPSKSADGSRQWPVSPRLKSPPPPASPAVHNQSRTSSPKPQEDDAAVANTSSKRQPSLSRDPGQSPVKQDAEINADENRPRPSQRVFARGSNAGGPVLATVQEAGTPVAQTPSITSQAEVSGEEPALNSAKPASGNGSDSGGSNHNNHTSNNDGSKATDSKGESQPQTQTSNNKSNEAPSKRSVTSLSAARGKPGESSMKNMIVETETVSSIPQLSLGGGAMDRSGANRKESGSGSVRMKPSDETIRPKKEKRKQGRKAAAFTPGTASSKADVFEAKVASAVDDADTSDSEETFVYESNPPDSHAHRQHRYHSRTPSATSMVSQIDQYGGKPRSGLREASHVVTQKRSMKFTNNTYNTMNDNGDEPAGSRANSRTSRHYHTGRPARNGTHLSLLDQSPFASSRGVKSPRPPNNGNGHNNNKFANQSYRSNGTFKDVGDAYDYDFDAEGADDERTPLVVSSRSRNRQGRRPNSASMRQMEYIEQRRRSWFSRYGFCLVLIIFILALIGGATTFIVGISKSVRDLEVIEIQNVLASEQELMLDLDVVAINPNLVSITMDEMDVNIFAKSRFVGGDGFWRDHGPHPEPLPRNPDSRRRSIMAHNVRNMRAAASSNNYSPITAPSPSRYNATGVDRGTDPEDPDPTGDPQTMLLGRIFRFDQPLTFEPSPWNHGMSRSIGQVRLPKPGNRTEEGGSIRWERVLQHQFELIVRGVVKYQLPLGSSSHSESISSSTKVDPNSDDVGGGDGKEGEGDKGPENEDPDNSDDGSVHTN